MTVAVTPTGTLPFPRLCSLCGAGIVVHRPEPAGELVITRFWLFECISRWCPHSGTLTMIRPPGFPDSE